MSGLSEKEERDAVDNVTNAMFSVGFLDSISLLVNTPRGHDLSVGDFYEQWLAGASPKQRKLPISPGIIVGLLYLALVYGKELWFDQLPDVPVCQAEEAWGITRAMYSCPKESRPSLRYVVRRLRNAMAHGNVTVHVLPAPPSPDPRQRFKRVTVSFHDEDPRDPADTFDVELVLTDLFRFVKKYQNAIHRYVREKYGLS